MFASISPPPGPGAACQRSGMLRIHKMWVKFPSALTCPGTHDPTSPQSFPMRFTKFSKSLKIKDNIMRQLDPDCPNFFFPPLGNVTAFAAFYFSQFGCFVFCFYSLSAGVIIAWTHQNNLL